jgi:hypothetical protein
LAYNSDRQLLNAINDNSITGNISTITGNTTEKNGQKIRINGGGFMGNVVKYRNTKLCN